MEIEFGGNDTNVIATIPPVHASWKPVVIRDDGHEVTVFYGSFTHWHYKYYGDDVPIESKAQAIAEDVVEELAMVFDDQIEFLGSCMGPRGSHGSISKGDSGSIPKLWSGKESLQGLKANE